GGGGPTTMIKQLIEKTLSGEPATVGSRVIENVYSKDAARGTVLALEARSPVSRIYNISMGKIYKPEEIASIVSRLAPNSKISIEESSGGPAVKVVEPISLARSKAELGYTPRYNMPQAISDYISSIKSTS
ncbi:MAG: NAD(P)-dependent oxidoreductase, partial [Thaumarchaeota archaeon]|nr:NAD(P)-dependent oxidoreductase [Nitrososphaerota archaeon]